MKRNEYKVNINVLGSNNGQKVRRGIKPGLLVEESDGVSNNLYLFSHNRALNNCNYLGNRKGFLSVWKFDETHKNISIYSINEDSRTGMFGGVLFTISFDYSATATTATTATETTTTTTIPTTETTNNTNNMESNNVNNTNNTNNTNNATSQNINVDAGGAFSAMVNGIAIAVQQQVLNAINAQLDERLANLPSGGGTTTIKLQKVDGTTTERETSFTITEDYKQVLNCAANRLPVYLFGPAGTGKTTFAMEIAKDLNLPCYIQGTTNDIFALQGIKLPNGDYIKSNVQKAVENGGVLLLDECDSYPEDVQTWFNSLLANRKISFTDCGTIEAHKDLVIIGAGNTNGNGQNDK